MAGASGGTKITTSTADVTIRALLFDQELNRGIYSSCSRFSGAVKLTVQS